MSPSKMSKTLLIFGVIMLACDTIVLSVQLLEARDKIKTYETLFQKLKDNTAKEVEKEFEVIKNKLEIPKKNILM